MEFAVESSLPATMLHSAPLVAGYVLYDFVLKKRKTTISKSQEIVVIMCDFLSSD
ncbi:MAG: hypothetical protein R3Y63_08110 [Eubacteriales bacterium]